MSKQIIISVMSVDRPGIIAEITDAIYSLNGNLADLNQSVLRGYFNMIIFARFNETITITAIKDKIVSMNKDNPLNVIVQEIDETITNKPPPLPDDSYIITGQAKDRTGLVASVAAFCKKHNINIIDYDTTLVNNVYSMILEIDLTNAEPAEIIHQQLDTMAQKMNITIVMHNKKFFDTINEISLT